MTLLDDRTSSTAAAAHAIANPAIVSGNIVLCEVPLVTDRLVLRELEVSDAPWVARESGRPEVARHLALVPEPNPALFAEMFILTVRAKRADHVFAVTLKETGQPIGVIGAHLKGDQRDAQDRPVYGFGYWYAPAQWAKGYATEAGQALVNALHEAGAGRLDAGYFTTNPASARVLSKLGFTPNGDDSPQFCVAQMKHLPHRGMSLAL